MVFRKNFSNSATFSASFTFNFFSLLLVIFQDYVFLVKDGFLFLKFGEKRDTSSSPACYECSRKSFKKGANFERGLPNSQIP